MQMRRYKHEYIPPYFRRLRKNQQQKEFAALSLEAKIEKIRKEITNGITVSINHISYHDGKEQLEYVLHDQGLLSTFPDIDFAPLSTRELVNETIDHFIVSFLPSGSRLYNIIDSYQHPDPSEKQQKQIEKATEHMFLLSQAMHEIEQGIVQRYISSKGIISEDYDPVKYICMETVSYKLLGASYFGEGYLEEKPEWFSFYDSMRNRNAWKTLAFDEIEKTRKPKNYKKAEEIFLQLHYATGAMLHTRDKEILNDVRERIFHLECDFDRGEMADLFAPPPWNVQYEYQKRIVRELAGSLRTFSDCLLPTAYQAGRNVPYDCGCDI